MLIDICFCIDESYITPLKVAIASLRHHAGLHRYRIYIIHNITNPYLLESLSDLENQREISAVVLIRGRSSPIIEAKTLPYVSEVCFYRIELESYLPLNVHKVIYLDADIIVRDDLSGLWTTALGDQLGAAVIDHHPIHEEFKRTLPALQNYFNCGVLVLDMKALRSLGYFHQCSRYAQHHQYNIKFGDQDIMNAILGDRLLNLNPAWNAYDYLFESGRIRLGQAKILHFNTAIKPWQHSYPFGARRNLYEQFDGLSNEGFCRNPQNGLMALWGAVWLAAKTRLARTVGQLFYDSLLRLKYRLLEGLKLRS